METVAFFVIGALIANSLPHIINGASGRRFPTPFARPPGRGPSSPIVNAAWGIANLYAAAALYHLGVEVDRAAGERIPMGVVAAGFSATLIALAWWFGRADRPDA
ncbi:hypothetical protein [uncultured Algimonas sp.]|uniref:hypothetical protein n=1 Tax=uncultured Algimonas sp. TaxID=1547920 RepID=UPI002608EBFE|nr:hypothetical protein [uncultured Algimonas sp.]